MILPENNGLPTEINDAGAQHGRRRDNGASDNGVIATLSLIIIMLPRHAATGFSASKSAADGDDTLDVKRPATGASRFQRPAKVTERRQERHDKAYFIFLY